MTGCGDSNKDLLTAIASEDAMRTREKSTLPKRITKTVPLTEARREIWYAAQMSDSVSCSFNVSDRGHLRGSLDMPRLWRSTCCLMERPEALRFTLTPDGGKRLVAHVVSPDTTPDLEELLQSHKSKDLAS
ncbi:MAG: amino acid adenylation domain protein [Pedosphaera sp.]|nr:amino acid adenylation domain protein [Pedosphaera sp.]